MAGPLRTYAFINAKLRARLSKISSAEFIEHLIRVPTLEEAVQLLRETDFDIVEKVYTKSGDLKLAEYELWRKEIHLYHDLTRYVKDAVLEFCRALAIRFEVANLKFSLRLWFDHVIRGRDITDSSHYLYREPVVYDLHVDRVLQAPDLQSVAQELIHTPYADIIRRAAKDIKNYNSIFTLEIELDRYYYSQLLHKIDSLSRRDAEIARRLIGVEIDLLNLNWITRFKTLYNLPLQEVLKYSIPYGFTLKKDVIQKAYQTENVTTMLSSFISPKYSGFSTLLKSSGTGNTAQLSLVERVLYHIMKQEIERIIVGYPFTIGIILAYLVLKGNEIKQIMTILNAKKYQIDEEIIRSKI